MPTAFLLNNGTTDGNYLPMSDIDATNDATVTLVFAATSGTTETVTNVGFSTNGTSITNGYIARGISISGGGSVTLSGVAIPAGYRVVVQADNGAVYFSGYGWKG